MVNHSEIGGSMKLKPYKKLNGLDYEQSKTVQYTEEWISQFKETDFISGNLIEVSVSTTATKFNHGLGVQPLGWMVLDKTSGIDVWRTDWDDKTITLDATGSASIKVWVF
jgi:hypothetical protein